MKKEKKKASTTGKPTEPSKEKIEETTKQVTDEEEFDYGGMPKNVPFKRNIGCGG